MILKYLSENDDVIASYECNFILNGKPEQYARARAGRGGFYNPKGKIKKDQEKELISQIKKHEKYDEIFKLIQNKDNVYYIVLEMIYYVEPSNSDSKKQRDKKLNNVVLPGIAPDIDNYLKFTLDALHNVIYDNDKRVISVSAHKLYNEKSHSDIKAYIYVTKIKE